MTRTYGIMGENWAIRKNLLLGLSPLVRFPREDAFAFDNLEEIAAAGDGVTRDCYNGRAAAGRLRGFFDINLYYPRNPDPAQIAATTGVRKYIELMRDIAIRNRDGKAMKRTILDVNWIIGEEGKKLGLNPKTVDYLVNDFPGTALAATAVREHAGKRVLTVGHICDCGVAVFDENGNLITSTPDEGPERSKEFNYKLNLRVNRLLEAEGHTNFSWQNSRKRQITRSGFRNNPKELFSYGVLTGEPDKKIEPYIKTEECELHPGFKVVCYTDGAAPIMFNETAPGKRVANERFADLLRKGDEKGLSKILNKKVRSEGTIVVQEF